MSEERRKIRVSCSIPNGIELRLFVRGVDDGTGAHPYVEDRSRPRVFLAGPSSLHAGVGNTMMTTQEPAVTEVDEEYFAEWLKQNEKNTLVTGGLIAQMGEERTAREEK